MAGRRWVNEVELLQVKPSDVTVDPTLKRYKKFEVDLRGELNPTGLLEKLFWYDKQWLDFADFASLYWQAYEPLLRLRFPKIFASLGDAAYTHLRARLYRTQFGFLTEYHAVILLASVFSPRGYTVWRGSALDRVGVDCQIMEPESERRYNIHIFVDSERAWYYREQKRTGKASDKVVGEHIDFPYTLEQGYVHSLRMLKNGFGVYTEEYARRLLEHIERGTVDDFQKELTASGNCLHKLVF